MNDSEFAIQMDAARSAVWERMMSLHHLGKTGGKTPGRVAVLLESLHADPDHVIRHDAAFVLGALPVPEAAPALCIAAIRDESFLVRHEALESLAFMDPSAEVLEALDLALEDSDFEVRETARMARDFHCSPPGRIDAASLVCLDLPMHFRWAAAFRLLDDHIAGGGTDAVALLKRCLRSDPSSLIRHTAAFMLEEVSGVSARDDLSLAALHDPSVLVRHEAVETLGFMPPECGTETLLEQLLASDDPVIRDTARIALDIQHARRSGSTRMEKQL